jgi:hypothetical protein
MLRPTLGVLTITHLVFAQACNPYACVYETRFVSVGGSVAANGATVTVVSMSFRQYRPNQPVSNSLSYVARGEALPAAATSLTLVDDRDPARTIATLSFQGSLVSFSAASAVDVASSERDSMFELLDSGHGQVILRMANGASMTVPLVVAIREDWNRPNCD